jgi:predicted aconitase
MGWISQFPEVWGGSALLIVAVAAIARAVFSSQPDARLEFFLRLWESFSADVFVPDESNPLPVKQNT